MKSEPLALVLQSGTVVRGLRWGQGRGPRVLALHGWLDNAHSFVPLAQHLGDVDLVAIDLPGHGLSDPRPQGAFYHFVDWLPDVLSLLDALGWQEAVLLGHSMGAGIASLVAGVAPERIRSLVLLEGLGPLTSPPETMPERVLRAHQEMARVADKSARPYASLDMAATQLLKVAQMTHANARLLCERGMRQVEGGFVWRADPRLRITSPMRMTQDMVLPFLQRIQAPTLLIRGQQGMAFDQEGMAQRTSAIPTLKLVEIAGSHHLHMDHPHEVAQAITPYLLSPKR